MDRQRIAFITPGVFAVPSPVSSSVEQTVVEMAGKLQSYVDVDVYGRTSSKQPRRERLGGVTYYRVPRSGKAGYAYAARIVKLLRRRGYRVIQVENRPRLAAYIKRKLPETTVWLFLHSLTFITPRKGREEHRLRLWLARPDRILVNSFYLAEEVQARFPELQAKLLVNHLGVNPGQFVSRWTEESGLYRERRLARLGLRNRRIILYVGRLIPIKGVHHLLEGMRAIGDRNPDAMLVLVGGAAYGSNRETLYIRQLKRMARRYPGRVRFVPFVPHNRIQEWFRLADLAVVPSPAKEAFGLVNVEAMATGLPVVACAAGGMTEVVLHDVTGYLVPPERLTTELPDRITDILQSADLQRQLGLAGLQRVREYFAWEHAAARWLKLMEEHV